MKYFYSVLLFLHSIAQANTSDIELEVVTEHWPPFIIKGKEVDGIVTNKVREILNETNLSYSISLYPWARSYNLAMSKPNVLIYSIYRSKERESHFHWFCHVHKNAPVFAYKLKTNNIDISSLAALKNVKIGLMRGDNSHEFFLSKGFKNKVNLYISATEENNVMRLLNNEVDVVIQSIEALRYRLNELGGSQVEIVAGYQPHKNEPDGQCMALSKGTNSKIVQQVKNAFQNWQKKNSLIN